MAVFKFRLAAALRLRERVRDQKHWELRALHETRRQMITEIDALEDELAEGSAALTEGQIFAAIELRLHAEHNQSLAKRIHERRITLAKFDDKVAEKRAELVDAMRAVKSLEQLSKRHEERYWREQNAAEQRFGDEIAQRKFTRSEGRKNNPR
jgi:flagellar export protein FliJ